MSEKTSIGERIRKTRGLETQTQFASRLGITQRAVVNYETLGRIPKNAIIRKICERYGVEEAWLLTGDGPMYQDGGTQASAPPKMADMSAILDGDFSQHTDFIDSGEIKMADMSAILRLTERCLQLSAENGDLRVEAERLRMDIERREARIAELERQLAEKGDGAANSQADIARLNSENRALREKVRQFERMDLHLRHYSDTLQNGLPDEE